MSAAWDGECSVPRVAPWWSEERRAIPASLREIAEAFTGWDESFGASRLSPLSGRKHR
jgi:hypothetical protein